MKIIAKTKDGDIFQVRLQRNFPNCQKYTKCCDDDKEFFSNYKPLGNSPTIVKRLTKTDKVLQNQNIPHDFYEPKQKPWDGK